LITARADETRWHIRDDVGTARIALDQTGSLANVRRSDHLPFGEELTGGVAGRTAPRGYAPTNERNRFTGHARDQGTGYDHTLWRKLDSVQGRRTSPDPDGGSMEIGNPQSFNRYAYVLNDPVNLMDPLGLNPFRTVCYVDGIQSDCGFAMQMVDSSSAFVDNGGAYQSGLKDLNGGDGIEPNSLVLTYFITDARRFMWQGQGLPWEPQGRPHPIQPMSMESMDNFQAGLDVAGMVPLIGEPIDLFNGTLSAARGNYWDAALSMAAMIPFAGNFATGTKLGKKALARGLWNVERYDRVVEAGKFGKIYRDPRDC
jgi:RHS repeat-associated protein